VISRIVKIAGLLFIGGALCAAGAKMQNLGNDKPHGRATDAKVARN
jgi:hypothetical protein